MINTYGLPVWFCDYMDRMAMRHRGGMKTYGQASYDKSTSAVLDEMAEEAIDIAGWGAFLYHKIESMKEKIAERSIEDEVG